MTAAPKAGPASWGERLSLEAIQQSARAKAVAGLLLAAAVAATVYTIVAAFTGHFTDVVRVRAELPPGSNAVPVAAPVEYRYVTVGKVGSETQAPDGSVAVEFEIYPKNLRLIPKGVEAQVAPLSIFGNQYINLVPPAGPAPAGHLGSSDFVQPYTGAASSSLQGTVTQLYNLLHAVHPADLDVALTAFAEALNGVGPDLGHALAGTSDYLGGAVVPNLGNVIADNRLLDPVTTRFEAATPDLLGLLSNSTVTAQTITSQQAQLHSFLSAGSASVGKFGSVLQQVQTSLPQLINESGPLLNDVTANPQGLAQTLSGLTQFATAVVNAEQAGPFLSVTANLPVADISAGVNAALGYDNPASVDAALGNKVNPPTYTAGNCPTYGGEPNPYCGVGGSPAAAPVAAASSTASPPSSSTYTAAAAAAAPPAPASPYSPAGAAGGATPAELAAVYQIATALNGGQPPASPGLAAIVLLPLLSSVTGQA